MTEFKGTPGPWVTTSSGLHVKNVELDVIIAYSDVEKFKQAKANAQLIAAAPELLKSLQKLMFWDNGKPEYDVARAVINKALGKGE